MSVRPSNETQPRPTGRRRYRSTAWLTLAIALLGGPILSPAAGPLMPVPQISPLPFPPAGLSSPDWWDPIPPQPSYGNKVDDPRWNGSASIDYGSGTGHPTMEFRSAYDASNVYLSWNMPIAPSISPTGNTLFVGWGCASGTATAAEPNVYIELTPFISLAPDLAAVPPTTINVFTQTTPGGAWTPSPSVPGWLSGRTRVWLTTANGQAGWAVNICIPRTGAAIPADYIKIDPGTKTFPMFFQVFTGSTTPGGNITTSLAWPRAGVVKPDPVSIDPIVPTDITSWGSFHIWSGPGDPVVTSNVGVSIDVMDIGTVPVPPNIDTQTILYDPTGVKMPVNTLYAMPTNNTGSSLLANSIQARFRIANWGSNFQPNDAVSGPEWADIPGLQNVPNTAAIPNTQKASQFAMTGTWIVGDPILTALKNGAQTDQCLLVELSSGGPINFVNKSVRRNMTFKKASIFQQKAEISLRNVPFKPTDPPKRDVYLYVNTLNMPEKVVAGGGKNPQGPVPAPSDPVGKTKPESPPAPEPKNPSPPPTPPVEGGNALRSIEDATPKKGEAALPKAAGEAAKDSPAPARGDGPPGEPGPTPLPVPTADTPSYVVYVWHDTGQRIKLGGVERKILQEQTAFGYYIQHDGPLVGWKYGLEGAVEIAPNYYKISVDNGGVANVTTTIEAIETDSPGTGGGPGGGGGPGPVGGIPWWVWLIVVLLLILLLLFLFRKKSP